jgi:hypothetical protein
MMNRQDAASRRPDNDGGDPGGKITFFLRGGTREQREWVRQYMARFSRVGGIDYEVAPEEPAEVLSHSGVGEGDESLPVPWNATLLPGAARLTRRERGLLEGLCEVAHLKGPNEFRWYPVDLDDVLELLGKVECLKLDGSRWEFVCREWEPGSVRMALWVVKGGRDE